MTMNNKEYGAILRETREKLGLSFEKISKGTKITINILKGLEAMDKSILPSEAYRIGMLKVYAKYLKIDVDEIISAVRINEIQETPIAFDLINLKEQEEKRRKRMIFISLIFVSVALILLFFISGMNVTMMNSINARIEEAARKRANNEKIETKEGFFESSFSLRDKFRLVSGTLNMVVSIESVRPIRIAFDRNLETLQENKPFLLDMNNDNKPEYTVVLRAVNVAKEQINLRFDPNITQIEDYKQINSITKSSSEEKVIVSDGTTIDVLSSGVATAIQLELRFSQLSYYKIISENKILKEDSVVRGDIATITSEKPLQIYLANDGFVEMFINDKKIEFPKNGLPLVVHVEWKLRGTEFVLQAIPIP